MTVASVKNKVVFACDGINTAFSFDFKVLKADHLKVYVVDGDSEALLILDVDYAVTNINEDVGGEIALAVPPNSGLKLVIVRELLPVQETAFKNQGPFYPQIHESAFDQVVMLIQQMINTIGDTVGTDARGLILGLADTDGQGAYRAKGNRITNLGKPVQETDAARVLDLKPFADAAQQAAQDAQNSSQQASLDAEEAKQAAEEAHNSALSIDTSTFYTKEEANTAIATAIDPNIYLRHGLKIADGTNVDTVLQPGTYTIENADKLLGLPAGIGISEMEVTGSPTRTNIQKLTTSQNLLYTRRGFNGDFSGECGTWTKTLTPADFLSQKSTSGYQKLPGGLILQWTEGSRMVAETSYDFNFPIAFPNACLFATASQKTNSADIQNASYPEVLSWTNNTIKIFCQLAGGIVINTTPQIFAIGH